MIVRLAHVELAVTDLAATRRFWVDVLGFEEARCDARTLWLRGAEEFDEWSLALTERRESALLHAGFRCDSPDDLDRLEARHRELGHQAAWVEAGYEPHQGRALRVSSPHGHPLEFFHDFDERALHEGGDIRLPMRNTHVHRGLPPAYLDHVNLRCSAVDDEVDYWHRTLGFSISERVIDDAGGTRLAWLRRRRGSHDVALGLFEHPALHHVAYTLRETSDVLRAADLLADAGFRSALEFGPGRHGVSNAMTLYVRDPSGHRLELYSGDYQRDLDRPPIDWPLDVYERQGRMWWGTPPPDSFRTDVVGIHSVATP
jgi:catechol 2,3-dioxygenase